MSDPLITIIIPTRNVLSNLLSLLDLITMQEFKSYQILIIDNLSSDDTSIVLNDISKNNSRIDFVTEFDKGIYDAMNKGISLAKGEWLYFMGSDDSFYSNNTLADISKHLTYEYDIVYGDVRWIPGGEIEMGKCTPKSLIDRNINHQRIFYRSSLFKKFGVFNIAYTIASDYELNIRYFCNDNIQKKYIPIIIANYYSGGFSAHKQDEQFWQNWKIIYKENILKHINSKNMYLKLGWYCRYLIERRRYKQSIPYLADVFLHTLSPGILLLTIRQFINSLKQNAG